VEKSGLGFVSEVKLRVIIGVELGNCGSCGYFNGDGLYIYRVGTVPIDPGDTP